MADLLIDPGRVRFDGVSAASLPTVNPPEVDYAALRQGAASAGQMSQVLDRLSTQLFGQAAEFAKEAGAQYVAENPVTQEQLEAAKLGDVTPLINRRGGTIFQKAVQKARSLEISQHFEAEGRNQLVKLLIAGEAGELTSEEVGNKITTMTEGYTSALSKIDPEATLKFRATMATHGNTVLKSVLEGEVKRAKEQRLAGFDMDFQNSVRLMEKTVAQGHWMDPKTGQARSIDELADVFRQNILSSALLVGDANLQQSYSAKFEKALADAKVNAVTAEVLGDLYTADPVAGRKLIAGGQVGKMTPVLAGMAPDDRAKVMANFMTAISQRETLEKMQRDDMKRQNQQRAVDILERVFTLPEASKARKDLISELIAIPDNGVPLGTLEKLLDPNQGEGNPLLLGNLYWAIDSGRITTPEQLAPYVGRGIKGGDYVQLIKHIGTTDRRAKSELDKGLNRLAGIPDIPGVVVSIDPKGTEFKRRQQLEVQANQIMGQAAAEGKVITPQQVIDQLERGIEEKRNSESAKQARTQLQVFEKMDWINGKITADSIPALRRKAGTDRLRLQQINRIEQLLKEAEGGF